MKQIVIIFWAILSGFAAICQDSSSEVVIISTNDVHGRIDNFSKMAAYVKQLKTSYKDVFVFNAGDLFNGNPVVDEALDKGFPIVDLMNDIPYDMSCPGNHEFEYGEAVMQQRISQSNSVYVCANINIGPASPLQTIRPFQIFRTGDGTTIAVLGLSASSSNPCIVKNISMQNPVDAALKYSYLRDSADILIALTHIGLKADSNLAAKYKGIDLIVGGHSHSEIPNGMLVNGTLITQAGDKMRFLGKTVLTIKNHKIVQKTFSMIDINSLTASDPAVQLKVAGYNNNARLHTIVGYSGTGFRNKEAIGCLKTDALVSALNLDIAFDHVRNISYSSFPKGSITLGDIYEWDSYDYKTLRYCLTPAEIRQLIINSMKNIKEPVLFVSGINYSITMNAANGVSTVELKNKNGLLDEKRRYTVGVNSFIACQYMKNIAAIPEELPTTAAIALTQYFIRHPKVNYQNVQRVFLR